MASESRRRCALGISLSSGCSTSVAIRLMHHFKPQSDYGHPLQFLLLILLLLLLLLLLLFSSPNLSGRRLDLPYFHTWCGPSANLECRCEMCSTRLAENAGPKMAKKSPSGHHRTTLSGCIFATKARIDNREKLVKQQYLLHLSSQYGKLRPTSGEIRWQVWGTPANFNGFRDMASLLQRRHSTEAN